MLPDGIGLELDPEAAAKRGAEAGKQLKDFLPNPPGQGGTISARLNPLEDLEVKPKAKKPRHEIIGEFNALAAGTEPLGRNDGKWVIGTSDNDLWFPYSTGADSTGEWWRSGVTPSSAHAVIQYTNLDPGYRRTLINRLNGRIYSDKRKSYAFKSFLRHLKDVD